MASWFTPMGMAQHSEQRGERWRIREDNSSTYASQSSHIQACGNAIQQLDDHRAKPSEMCAEPLMKV